MKIKSGGGANSRVVSHRYEPKTEPKSRTANVAGVAQQGVATQFKKEPLFDGKGYSQPKITTPTGIANATYNAATSGPGSQRAIYKAGSQSPTPPAREMPKGREILGEYGPEISGPSRRR